MNTPCPADWWGIDGPDHKRMFAAEFVTDLGDGNPLKGLDVGLIARASWRDDYPFRIADGRVAVGASHFRQSPPASAMAGREDL